MMVYEVFRAFNLLTCVRPVLYLDDDAKSIRERDDSDGDDILDRVGDTLSAPVINESNDYDRDLSEILHDYPHHALDVQWHNGPAPATENLQLAYMVVSSWIQLLLMSLC